jgi:cysteine desulfuration protein SufE
MTIHAKQDTIKAHFADCKESEARYNKIIELGRTLALDECHKTPANQVLGCQSQMYLHSRFEDNKVYFEAASDALISAGLAALLVSVYSGESPEVILKHPPTYIEELGIAASVTPSRANGLYSIHLRMKQDALKFLMKQ